MIKSKFNLPIIAFIAVVVLSGCASTGDPVPKTSAPASSTSNPAGTSSTALPSSAYPVSIENCGRTLTFDAAPERVVSLWQAPTEMMLALGLEDRITAVAGNYAAYPDSIAKTAAALPLIGNSMSWPSKEVLLSQAPDLVVGQSLEGFAFDTSQGYASVEQIEEGGSQVYGSNLCSSSDALNMTLETPYRTLRDFGIVFGVSDRAEDFITQMEEKKQKVISAVKGLPTQRVAFYNGGDGPLIVLAGGIYDDAIATAGGENVFPADSVYVSKEEFAASNADVILVGTFEGQDFATLSNYLITHFPDLPAVKNGKLVEIHVADTDASISVMRGLTEIANGIHSDLNLEVPAS
ncbi:ABC transporter substrate-binding protein [Paenibacillus sp. F411]|uniref:Periplasmic binding protein n=1 Tax=Paenibacillus algicola TaxID=2565926 RepID=A0A4P8XQD1_9BACL|nr:MULTISPECIES: ABC transporter substrate-binding protein [Paenibacillus]MBO2944632.1 ABC transporter substrate-binding protein [Paenibacillus sp. F411]QCT04733.1 periplasmic binding protein [Paenibacillus algicola]